jgi:hypothetical protein
MKRNFYGVFVPSTLLICIFSILLFLPDNYERNESKNLPIGPNTPIIFSDGPVKVNAISFDGYCNAKFPSGLVIRGYNPSKKEPIFAITSVQIKSAESVFKKSSVCENKKVGTTQDLQILNFKNTTRLNIKNAEIIRLVANENSKIRIHTSLYENSGLRNFIGKILICLLLFFIIAWTLFQIRQMKVHLQNKIGTLFLPLITMFIWAIWGPSIYDEGWVLATGKSFGDLGWFSNVYSNSGAPMPLGNVFNYLTYILTQSPNQLLYTRALWFLISMICVIQMIILMSLFKNLSKSLNLFYVMIYVCYLIAFGGGWRPEILILLLFNSLLLHLYLEAKTNKFVIVILVGVGLSTAQSGIIFLAPLIYHFYKVKTKWIEVLSTLSSIFAVFLVVSLSFTNLSEFINGINEFRSSSSHKTVPIFGEILRYAPFLFGVQSLVQTLAFIFLVLSVTSVVLVRLSDNRRIDFSQVSLLSSLFLLSFTPSKWSWHLLPLAPLVTLNIMQFSRKLNFQRKSVPAELTLLLTSFLTPYVAFKSLAANSPVASGYPFKSLDYPVFWVSITVLVLMILAWRIFFRQPQWPSIDQLQKGEGHQRKALVILSTSLISALIFLPIVENYSLSSEKVSKVHERRSEAPCKTFAYLKTLAIDSDEISKNQQRFLGSGPGPFYSVNFKTLRPPVTPGHKVYYFSIKAEDGAIISLRDIDGTPQSVIDLTLPGRQWSSFSSNDKFLRKFFDSRQVLLDGVYIYPSPSSQVVSFSTKSKLSSELIIKVSSPGDFLLSRIATTQLLNLSTISDRSPTMVIPPLVSNFGCVSNTTFTNSELISELNIIQDGSMWFNKDQNNTFKHIIDKSNSTLIPVYGTKKPGLFSVLQIKPFTIHSN